MDREGWEGKGKGGLGRGGKVRGGESGRGSGSECRGRGLRARLRYLSRGPQVHSYATEADVPCGNRVSPLNLASTQPHCESSGAISLEFESPPSLRLACSMV